MNRSVAIADPLREASFALEWRVSSLKFRVSSSTSEFQQSERTSRNQKHETRNSKSETFERDTLHARTEYSRLLTAVTFFCSVPQAGSSVERLGPIRVARPENRAGMHAIGGVFGQNNPGTDAGKCGG